MILAVLDIAPQNLRIYTLFLRYESDQKSKGSSRSYDPGQALSENGSRYRMLY